MTGTIRSRCGAGRLPVSAMLLWPIVAVLLALPAAALEPPKTIGAAQGIVARVNGDPVPRAELARLLADPLERDRLQKELVRPDPDGKELERLALRELIRRRLLLQEAGRRGFAVGEKELDQALSALRSRFGDLGEFGAWMKERGLDDKSLSKTLGAQILMNRVWSEIVKDVRLTEKQAGDYFEAHKDELVIGEEVRLRIIAVGSKAAAEGILAALRKGGNFSRLAKTRSLGKRAAHGGDTGWLDSRAVPAPLRETVAALKEGDVGGPVQRGADEFLIVGLRGRRPLRANNVDEARPEMERRLLPGQRREAVEAWLAGQERKSNIELLSRPESPTDGEVTGKGGQGG